MPLTHGSSAGGDEPNPAATAEGQADAAPLADRLADPDPQTRRLAALDALAMVEAKAARGATPTPPTPAGTAPADQGEDEVVVAWLCAALAREDNAAVMEALVAALLARGDDRVVAGLVPLLRADNPTLRSQIVTALQALPGPTGAIAETLIADPDPAFRIQAVTVLQDLPDPRTNDWLRRILETDPDVNVCMAAAEALIETGTPEMIPALIGVKHRFGAHPFVTVTVDHIIGLIAEKAGRDE